jgi:tight adherence protein C
MTLLIFAFVAIFILIGSAGILVFLRSGMTSRLASAVSPQTGHKPASWFDLKDATASLKAIAQPFEKIVPKSAKEVSIVQKRLVRAGYREDSNVRSFYGAKVLVPFVLCVLFIASGLGSTVGFIGYALVLGLGFLVPDFWLGRRISKRQTAIRMGLPDALDLIVVCIEAGLSLDQALIRTVHELGKSHPAICDEFGLVILEQRSGRPRVDAWRNLAERVDIDIIRMLVSAIVQVDQFGTSISKILRAHAETLRVQRRQNVEEQAAKTTVKLVFPLVLFIFPSVFVVTLGPAMIVISESFDKYFQ